MSGYRTEGGRPAAPRLLDRLRDAAAARHYSPRTSEAYAYWVRKFIVFHGKRHPDAMGGAEVKAFLIHLAVSKKVAPSTQNQALGALLFLYRRVLGRDLEGPGDLIRAKRSIRVPVVLSPAEISRVLFHLRGLPRLAAVLMYGSGLRLLECLQLRVRDLDFERGEILVREGKGRKDRRTLLPAGIAQLLQTHLVGLRQAYDREQAGAARATPVSETARQEAPRGGRDWPSQWSFQRRESRSGPATRESAATCTRPRCSEPSPSR